MHNPKPNENMQKILRAVKYTGAIILCCLIVTVFFQYYTISRYDYEIEVISKAVRCTEQVSEYAMKHQIISTAKNGRHDANIDYDEMLSSVRDGFNKTLSELDSNDALNKVDPDSQIRNGIKNGVQELYSETGDAQGLGSIGGIDSKVTLLILYLNGMQEKMHRQLSLLQKASYILDIIMIITSLISLITGISSADRHKRDYETEKDRENYTDGLTGLFNQKYTTQILPEEVMADGSGYLLMLDMDNFKKVNDTFGHAAGDRALTTFAEVLRNSTRQYDIPCRLGGDEFIVYARNIKSDREAKSFAKRIQDNTAASFAGTELEIISISCGITPVVPGTGFEALKKRADKALYYVKEHGKGAYHLIKPKNSAPPKYV